MIDEKAMIQKMEIEKMLDNSSVIQVRLDTAYIIQRIKSYLTGKIQTIEYDDQGNPIIKEETRTQPKANDEGIQWILSMVENICNSAVVQGNFDKDMYYTYIYNIHDSLLKNLMLNLFVWGIRGDDYEPIIDNINAIIEPYVSRLIDNKERESYGSSIKVMESSQIQSHPKFNLFNRGTG